MVKSQSSGVMNMQKMKKSKTKPRSQRSIEHENERNRIIQEEEERKNRKMQSNKLLGDRLFCYYSLSLGILAWLFDYLGIFAILSVGMGIYGFLRVKEKKGRDYYVAIIGLVLGITRLITEIIPLLQQMK